MIENLPWIKKKILDSLKEDMGYGDLTTNLIIPKGKMGEASVICEEEGVLAGLEEATVLFTEFNVEVKPNYSDGDRIAQPGVEVAHLRGPLRSILTCERTALNFLMRMSGVATATYKTVSQAKIINPRIRVAATRKTMPLLSFFDKKAVYLGGGDTHRLRLDDCILIKDNHIAAFGDIKKTLKTVKEKVSFTKKIEIEVESAEDALTAAQAGADIIMLDNMSPLKIIETINTLKNNSLRDTVILEASGGINEDNIEEYARTGVDIISIGKITHSARALNLKIDVKKC